jgi:hypothetical protein
MSPTPPYRSFPENFWIPTTNFFFFFFFSVLQHPHQHIIMGKDKKDKKTKAEAGDAVNGSGSTDYFIKPSSAAPALDTSDWPLLLKNYDS